MNEIKDCIDALLAAVQNSEEYQEFEKYRDLLKENPELMDRVNAFRGNNFRLQNEALVNAFLDAELALCKLMQKICRTLTEGIDLDIPEL